MPTVNLALSYQQAMALYGALEANPWEGANKLSEDEIDAIQAIMSQIEEHQQ